MPLGYDCAERKIEQIMMIVKYPKRTNPDLKSRCIQRILISLLYKPQLHYITYCYKVAQKYQVIVHIVEYRVRHYFKVEVIDCHFAG